VVRLAVAVAVRYSRAEWVEEVVLKTLLLAGFPGPLNAARVWRRALGSEGEPAGLVGGINDYERAGDWRAMGEATCAIVYGPAYEKLRTNIRALHPALDAWMIVEGYGKVLSRPGLDLARRELCIVAACATSAQDRQLHSHLHGAMHAGAGADAIEATLDAIGNLMSPDRVREIRMLWARVRTQHESRQDERQKERHEEGGA
jgi:4-carboxymuconolactone decarboxylase